MCKGNLIEWHTIVATKPSNNSRQTTRSETNKNINDNNKNRIVYFEKKSTRIDRFVCILCKTLECEWDSSQNDCTVVKCTLHPLSSSATKNIVTKSHYVTSSWMQFWAFLRFSFPTGIGSACTIQTHTQKNHLTTKITNCYTQIFPIHDKKPCETNENYGWERKDENTAIVASIQTVCVFFSRVVVVYFFLCVVLCDYWSDKCKTSGQNDQGQKK